MRVAAESKWNSGAPVEDEAREERLIAGIVVLAPWYRIDPRQAEAALAEARAARKAAMEEAAGPRQELKRRRSTGPGVWDVWRGRGRVSRRVEAAGLRVRRRGREGTVYRDALLKGPASACRFNGRRRRTTSASRPRGSERERHGAAGGGGHRLPRRAARNDPRARAARLHAVEHTVLPCNCDVMD